MSPRLSALVTGASRGIGAAIARALAARGVRVAVHYQRNEAAARATLAALTGSGHRLVQGDLSDAAGAEAVWTAATGDLGPVGLLVNNAGIYETHPILACDFDGWQDLYLLGNSEHELDRSHNRSPARLHLLPFIAPLPYL